MTLFKDDMVTAVAAETGLTKKDSGRAIDALLDMISTALSQGDSVQLTGFGAFEMKKRNSRTGRNPHTGEAVPIPSRYIPSFNPSGILKTRCGMK